MSTQGEGNPSQRHFIDGLEEDDQELDDACDTVHYGILQGSRVLPNNALPSPSPSLARSGCAASGSTTLLEPVVTTEFLILELACSLPQAFAPHRSQVYRSYNI